MNDRDIIDLYKQIRGFRSDRQAAKALGITNVVLSNIRTGRNGISPRLVAKMAKDAGEAGNEILAAWAELAKERVRRIMYIM